MKNIEQRKTELFEKIMYFERTKNYSEFKSRLPSLIAVMGEPNHECLIFDNYFIGKAEDLKEYFINKLKKENIENKNVVKIAIKMLDIAKPSEVITVHNTGYFYELEQPEENSTSTLNLTNTDTVNMLAECVRNLENPINNYHLGFLKNHLLQEANKKELGSNLNYLLINRKENKYLASISDENDNKKIVSGKISEKYMKQQPANSEINENEWNPQNKDLIKNIEEDMKDFYLSTLINKNIDENYEIAYLSENTISDLIDLINGNLKNASEEKISKEEKNKVNDMLLKYLKEDGIVYTVGTSYLGVLDNSVINKEYFNHRYENIDLEDYFVDLRKEF